MGKSTERRPRGARMTPVLRVAKWCPGLDGGDGAIRGRLRRDGGNNHHWGSGAGGISAGWSGKPKQSGWSSWGIAVDLKQPWCLSKEPPLPLPLVQVVFQHDAERVEVRRVGSTELQRGGFSCVQGGRDQGDRDRRVRRTSYVVRRCVARLRRLYSETRRWRYSGGLSHRPRDLAIRPETPAHLHIEDE